MRTPTLLASMAMFGACVGGIDMPSGGGGGGGGSGSNMQTPQELFNSTVSPLLQSECASCHVGPETSTTDMFLGQTNNATSYYNGIVNDAAVNGDWNPSAAQLLTKGTHEGPAWTATQASTVQTWLLAEAQIRGTDGGSGGGGGSSTNVDDSATGAEEQLAACMSVSNALFHSTQAYEIANMVSSEGNCYSCHNGGAGGAYWDIGSNYDTMWAKWQQEVFITGPYEASASSGTPTTYSMITASSRICDKGLEQQNGDGTHPAFDCNQTVDGVQPLQTLENYRLGLESLLGSGGCPAPAFAPPD
jgi:hypothetical protein